ncbi:MAG: hypothetical protein RMJ31_03310 [Nitrososphaerota archaeon]|nr:hypothetical protein [Nitrososphaerales archaeon]MDW8044785.1 hypothetical protein [Nitrososphaerota archaeon]
MSTNVNLNTLVFSELVCIVCGKRLGYSPINVSLVLCEEHTPKERIINNTRHELRVSVNNP